jgi:hypothetical protein
MTIIKTNDAMDDLIALAREIGTLEGLTPQAALLHAMHLWAALDVDIEADVRYLPIGQTIRPHVSLAAGVPALELA